MINQVQQRINLDIFVSLTPTKVPIPWQPSTHFRLQNNRNV